VQAAEAYMSSQAHIERQPGEGPALGMVAALDVEGRHRERAKQASRKIQPAALPRPSKVVNLMEAASEKAEADKSWSPAAQPANAGEIPPKRRAAAAAGAPDAAGARDQVRRSPRTKKTS